MPRDQLPKLDVRDITSKRSRVVIRPDKSSFSHAIDRTKRYKAFPEMMRPALEGLAEYVRQRLIPETFQREGPGWAALAPRTVAERVQGGFPGEHPILQRTGDLYNELTEKSHPNHVEVVMVGKDARIEIGGSSQKFIENQMGMSSTAPNLPKRAMIPGTGGIPIDYRHREEMLGIIKRTLAGKR